MLQNIFPKRAVVISPSIIVFTVFFLLSLYFVFYIRSIIVLLHMSYILMVALRPIVNMFQRRLRIPRALAIILTYLFVIALLGVFAAVLVPPLVTEFSQLMKTVQLPGFQESLRTLDFSVNELSNLAQRVGSSVGFFYSVVNSTFSGIFTIFTLFVLSLYMMLERDHLHKKLFWFTHDSEKVTALREFLDDVEIQLGGWVRGQAILMFIIGLLTYVGLALLSIPYALPLALLAGLFELLPNLGPVIAAVPAVFVAFVTYGPVMAGVVLLLSVIIQQLENQVIVPKVMSSNANVNPLMAITVILIGFEVYGVIGALLSIPTYIMIRALYGRFLRPKRPVPVEADEPKAA